MNGWLLASLIVVIVAVVVLMACIIAVIVPIKNTVVVLLAHINGILKQMNGIEKQTILLAATADKMKQDIDYKKEAVQGVVQTLKNTGIVLNEITESSQALTSKIMKKAAEDPARQAQVEQWTNRAMGFLNRKA